MACNDKPIWPTDIWSTLSRMRDLSINWHSTKCPWNIESAKCLSVKWFLTKTSGASCETPLYPNLAHKMLDLDGTDERTSLPTVTTVKKFGIILLCRIYDFAKCIPATVVECIFTSKWICETYFLPIFFWPVLPTRGFSICILLFG